MAPRRVTGGGRQAYPTRRPRHPGGAKLYQEARSRETDPADAAPPAAPRPETARLLPESDAHLGALLETLRPRLTSVALRFTRDADVAHDVVQNAFEKAIRHRAEFRGQARVSTWIHRIVANEALMWLRAERRRGRRLEALEETNAGRLIDPTPGPAASAEGREAADRLRRGIAALGDDERDVIEHCVLPERSYAEYGRERGVHPAAAKSRAFRARRRLRALLADA